MGVAGWRLAVGAGWQWLVLVAVGSGWRLAVGGDWWLEVGGWWRLVAVEGWWLTFGGGCRLVAIGSWWLAVDGGWWRLKVGGWWLAFGGGWQRLAVVAQQPGLTNLPQLQRQDQCPRQHEQNDPWACECIHFSYKTCAAAHFANKMWNTMVVWGKIRKQRAAAHLQTGHLCQGPPTPPPPRVQRTTKSSKNTVRTGVFVGPAVRYLINSVPKPET